VGAAGLSSVAGAAGAAGAATVRLTVGTATCIEELIFTIIVKTTATAREYAQSRAPPPWKTNTVRARSWTRAPWEASVHQAGAGGKPPRAPKAVVIACM